MSDLLVCDMYNGTVEYSKKKECLIGKVIGIKKDIEYEGDTLAELEEAFRDKVVSYIKDCEKQGIVPEQPYKGTFNVRIPPELHRQIAVYAIEHKKSLNAAVAEAIQKYMAQENKKAGKESK